MTAKPAALAERLVHAARDLDASARKHKREAERHRRAAQAARQKQAEIERQCAALGITVTYETFPAPRSGQRPTA
jgi:ribosomal protein L32E